ncbi:DUF255 domain-containing protein [Candidatus Woesearchaeota archaeon]|nr:DUF255 domain-containing protein [Candidatus Woesearchaeota archaeon]
MRLFPLFFVCLIALSSVLADSNSTGSVEWREYNQEAFDSAQRERKPVLMVITAVWCSPCREYRDATLNSPEITSYLQDHFIPVLVDADKRQDLTREFLAGGWPTTVIFDPYENELERVNGHILKDDLFGSLQEAVSHLENNGELEPLQREDFQKPLRYPNLNEFQIAMNNYPAFLLSMVDNEHGGFGQGEKFPHALALDFMLRHYQETKDARFLVAAEKTLHKMAQNNSAQGRHFGIYDPANGGFYRYAAGRDWSRPHYEKMLAENAELIQTYLRAYEITGDPFYKGVAAHGLEYLLGDLYSGEAFYGSQDGDGEYYHLPFGERKEKPYVDTTVYAEWNAEAIAAFAYASEVLHDEKYLSVAEHAMGFLLQKMVSEEGVGHYYDGGSRLNGLTLDNAWVIRSLLALYEMTKKEEYFLKARELMDYSLAHLYDYRSGGFIERNSTDLGFYPEGKNVFLLHPYGANGVMALDLVEMYSITNEKRYLVAAMETLGYSLPEAGDFEDTVFYVDAVKELIGMQVNPYSFSVAQPELHTLLTRFPFVFLLPLAFIAGLLGFLSFCLLPLLPGYFASAFRTGKRILFPHTLAFFLGFALVFSVSRASATVVGAFLARQNALFITYFGMGLVLLGFVLLLGKGFSGFRLGRRFLHSLFLSFALGIGFGLWWDPCAGPVFSGLIVLASSAQQWQAGTLLLFIYSLGFALPLLLLSYLLDRLGPRGLFLGAFHGRMISLRFLGFEREVHTAALVAGLVFVALGFAIMNGYLDTLHHPLLTGEIRRSLFSLEDRLLSLGRFLKG